MPVTIRDRYREIFQAHRFASEYRLKILTAWGVAYAALAAVFAWAQSNVKRLSWTVPLLGVAITLLLWSADNRNHEVINNSKSAGAAIEADGNAIPEDQRFFAGLGAGMPHSIAIKIFAIGMLSLLAAATVYLFFTDGELSK